MISPPVINDFDAMLEDLIAKTQAFDLRDESEIQDLVWLRDSSTPDDWHEMALWGFGDSAEPLLFHWIASRPNCEAATALVLFWMVKPDYYLNLERDREVLNDSQNPNNVSDKLLHFDMIEYIRNRWRTYGYTQRTVGFDYDRDLWPNEFESIDAQFGDIAKVYLPVSMRNSFDGRSPKELKISDNFPEEFRG